MKKYFDWCFIFSLVFAFVFILSINSYAKNNTWYEGRSGVGVRVSYLEYNNDNYELNDIVIGATPDDATGFGINYTYIADYYISFEFSADYIKTDLELSSLALGLSGNAGDMTQIPILLAGRFHPYVTNKVTPYFSAGLGYLFNHIDSNRDTAEFIYGSGARFEISDTFVSFVGGGIEVFFAKNIALNLDLKYIWTRVKGTVTKYGTATEVGFSAAEDFDIDPFVAGVGIKYYF